jgi:hypothetical protein
MFLLERKYNTNVLMRLFNKHECAERYYELKHNSGYSKAHDRAESHYKGYPWENKYEF